MLRRVGLGMALLTAAAVGVVVAIVIVIAGVIDLRIEHADSRDTVRSVASTADDVNEAPSGTVLIITTPAGQRSETPNAPAAVRAIDDRRLPAGASHVTAGGRSYDVYVDRRPNSDRVVALLDQTSRERGILRLVIALLVAGGVGIVAAATVGGLVGARAVRPLTRALDLQRRFVADASHELRTPLTVLHTRAQLLQRRLPVGGPGDAVRPDLDRLVHDIRGLDEVVTDMLLSAELAHRPGAGEPVDVADLAADVTATFAPQADKLGVTLTLAAGHPDDAVVTGTRSALRRAASALVDNALAHATERVEVAVQVADGQVRLSVADDGSGFDPGAAQALLGRFARGATAAGHGRRFGLGLALVQEVVLAHGGRLEIGGHPGEGATVTLVLRVADLPH